MARTMNNEMTLRMLSLLIVAAAVLPADLYARCVTTRYGDTACFPAGSRCLKNRYGDWMCSAPGGDAALTLDGSTVCGTGRCVRNINGAILCSSEPRGSAALDRYGHAVCSGGCAPALADSCQPLIR